MQKIFVATLIIVSCAAAAAQSWSDPKEWASVPQPTVIRDVVYASPGGVDQHMNIFQVTASKPTPVVIHIHGGGWTKGARMGNGNAAMGFFAAGISMVSIEYRLAPQFKAPAQMNDVRCAMSWVKANAAKYNWDPNKVILWGQSAGGHLSLMGGYGPDNEVPAECKDQPKVAAVLDDYGPTDLVAAYTQQGTKYAPNWLGDTPDAMVLAKEYSPMTYVRKGVPPTFIVNGDSDPTVNPAQDAELKAALDKLGVPNGQYIVPGGKHGGFGGEEATKAMVLRLKFLEANKIIP